MKYRTLGRTGIQVSPYCLGTMMFGAMGNPDHDDSIRIIHRALDAGINFVDTADVYSAGESEEIVGKALKGRRDDVVLASKVHYPMGDDPNHRGNSRRWIIDSGRELPAPPADRSPRPLPDPPPRPDGRRGGDSVGPVRPDPQRQGARHRLVDLPRLGDRRGAVGRRAARPRALPDRAAAVLDPQPEHRTRGAAGLPALRDGHAGLEPAGPGPAHRPLPQGPAGRHPPVRRHAAALRRRAQARRRRTAHPARRRRPVCR